MAVYRVPTLVGLFVGKNPTKVGTLYNLFLNAITHCSSAPSGTMPAKA
jgi:hypothetical protein